MNATTSPVIPKDGSYDRSARLYDLLHGWWSNGRVGQLQRAQLELIRMGERVLCAGVGTGNEALGCARRGALVTGVDIAPAMLQVARERLAREGLPAELICGDLFAHRLPGTYDVVCANFLFDTFSFDAMKRVAAHLVEQLRPGGRLLVAEVAPPQGSALSQRFVKVRHTLAFGFSGFFGVTPTYPIYDYPPVLTALGLDVVEQRFERLWSGGPVVYQHLTAVKR